MTKTGLPAGYAARPCTLADTAAVADLANRWSQATVGASTEQEENFRSVFQAPVFSPEEDTLLVEDAGQQPAGYAEIYDVNEPHVRVGGYAFVDPAHCGRGIGSYLVDWMVARARRGLERAPADARVVLSQFLPVQERAGAEILTRAGFAGVRTSYVMRIAMDAPPGPAELPAGIRIRPICLETELEEAVQVVRRSFHDHYGFVEEPIEHSIARWRYIIAHDSHFDPAMWFLALDGEQICGICYCTPFTEEDPQMGWVQTLGVLREWRGRGLGLALLRTAFAAFWERGMPRVGLSVDAESLTGATRLYERAGMQVYREYRLFEKELRPGRELSTQSLD